MSPPRFFVPGLSATARLIDLPEEEAHHITRVLRLHANEVVAVFDGRGSEWLARIAVITRSHVTVELQDPVTPVAEPPVAVTLAMGLLKGDQMDDVVRDATMMGVRAIVPMTSAHVTVPDRAWQGTRALDRWRRVAVASAKQCRRAVVPEIQPVCAFERVIAAAPAGAVDEMARLICFEPALAREGAAPAARPHTALVLIGPEGGWSEAEASAAMAAGFAPLALGRRTIRAERAPLVALSALWTRWGW